MRCSFLDSPDSVYVLNDSPSGWKCEAARRAVGIEQFEHDPCDEYWLPGLWPRGDHRLRPGRNSSAVQSQGAAGAGPFDVGERQDVDVSTASAADTGRSGWH